MLGIVLRSGALVAAESGPGECCLTDLLHLSFGSRWEALRKVFCISFILQQQSLCQAWAVLLSSDFCQPNKPNLNKTGSVTHLPLDSQFVF